jgi:ATP-dependent DNA helicase RecQ
LFSYESLEGQVSVEGTLVEKSQALMLLQRALGDSKVNLRPGQWEAIDALVNHRRKLLVVERTGWGKSLIYFISTRVLRDRGQGPTLIVSPLLALMRNQMAAAERLGIRAISINSTNRSEWPALQAEILGNKADALLISPERLANDRFVEAVLLPAANRIGLLVVDEAHCISDWGHDFRPDYRRLVNILKLMPPNMPVLGTTATANNSVLDDVQGQLGGFETQRGTLMRESLHLQTLRLADQAERLAWLAKYVPKFSSTGIIYTLTKKDAEQVAGWLRLNGVEAHAYYSGVEAEGFQDSDAYRQHLEELLLGNGLKALVATTALGMGFDKPDLGFVIHYQAPGSIVAYYQQVGRAGRAIDRALGLMMAGREDEDIHQFFRSAAFPDETRVNNTLKALEDSDGLTVKELQAEVNLAQSQIEQVLKYLGVENPAPVIRQGNKWFRTPVPYRMDHDRIRRLTQKREFEWQEVQGYVDTEECLMAYLGRALDDPHAARCGKCANCIDRPVVPVELDPELIRRAVLFLRQSELNIEPRIQLPKGAFVQYALSGNLPVELRAEPGRVLSRWGDAGWGRLAAEDKHAGRFRDELVEAVVEMILKRWRPEPSPAWVACAPSLKHPALVPDFAKRLAARLRLPFLDVVSKIKDNQPQKLQYNSDHQCRNLDGAFELKKGIPNTPVLLVDDMVDSRWTMTVIAALLRQAGSGPVLPVALASTSPNG